MDKEALLERAQQLHEQSKETEERLAVIEQQIQELNAFSADLTSWKEDKGSEFLAAIGKGVFVKASVKEPELFVEVGAGALVKKKVPEVQTIIAGQLGMLNEMRSALTQELHGLYKEFEKFVEHVDKNRQTA